MPHRKYMLETYLLTKCYSSLANWWVGSWLFKELKSRLPISTLQHYITCFIQSELRMIKMKYRNICKVWNQFTWHNSLNQTCKTVSEYIPILVWFLVYIQVYLKTEKDIQTTTRFIKLSCGHIWEMG